LVGWVVAVEALASLGSLTVQLDPGSLLLALAPVAAVVVNYYLARRQREAIARESTEKVAEVKHLVNSQQDHLNERNAKLEARIEQLEGLLAAK